MPDPTILLFDSAAKRNQRQLLGLTWFENLWVRRFGDIARRVRLIETSGKRYHGLKFVDLGEYVELYYTSGLEESFHQVNRLRGLRVIGG